MSFYFLGKMSLPQTVNFSISNVWYKLTQPTVYAQCAHVLNVISDISETVPEPAPEKKPGADPKEDGFETLRQTENTSELWLKNPYCEVDGFSGFVTCFLAADLGTGGVSCLLGACITQPVLNTGTGTSQLAAIWRRLRLRIHPGK